MENINSSSSPGRTTTTVTSSSTRRVLRHPRNKISPGPYTSNRAGIGNGFTIAEGTAGPNAIAVVVHAPGGAKIACADLT
jgi:hypothetical protein